MTFLDPCTFWPAVCFAFCGVAFGWSLFDKHH